MKTITTKQARALLANPPKPNHVPPATSADTVTGPCVHCGLQLDRADSDSTCKPTRAQRRAGQRGCGRPNAGTAGYQQALRNRPDLTPAEWLQEARDSWST